MKTKPPTHCYLAARRLVFSRSISRRFSEAAAPLFTAVEGATKAIKAASRLEDIPPFTEIAVQYGALLTRSLLLSYVKGSDSARKRKYRKNSINLDEIVEFSWSLQSTAAVAAFTREAFEMAAVQTQDLRDALFADARQVFASGGSYRDWAESFALHGFEPENPYHLRTNYDTAANAAYAAGQWEQIEGLKDVFPWLRYVTMQDEKVREEHAALDGLVYKVDDIFWLTYMPPNGWNCRCSVEQLMEDEFDPAGQPQIADKPLNIPPEFQNNPGKSLSLYMNSLTAPQTDCDKEGYGPMTNYPQKEPINPIKTDGLSPDELLNIYQKALEDRIIYDLHRVPVVVSSAKAGKLENYSLTDLISRVRYINCLEDLLKNPNEAWLQPDNSRRIVYIKRYDKDVIALAEIEKDNVLRYFNIMTSDHVAKKLRSGVPLFPK